MNIREFSVEDQKESVQAAIREAEILSSGEIRVHLENRCQEEVLGRAAFIFRKLDMHATEDRNGVLFYVAVKDQNLRLILGDAGINRKLPAEFWDRIKENMATHFKEGQFGKGIASGVRMAGEQLETHFPLNVDDKNELSDDISYGDD